MPPASDPGPGQDPGDVIPSIQALWRSTWLQPGQRHTIALVPPEDGAMIETYDTSPGFSVSLRNCTPEPVPPEAPAPAP